METTTRASEARWCTSRCRTSKTGWMSGSMQHIIYIERKMGRGRIRVRNDVRWASSSRGHMCMHVPYRCSCCSYRFAHTSIEGTFTAR
eukprot:528885-Pyramimonas_sp.AAC.1